MKDYVKGRAWILRPDVSRRTFVFLLMVLQSPKSRKILIDAVEDEVMVEERAKVTNGRISTYCEEDGTASRARRLLRFGIARSSVLLPHLVMSMSVLATYHQLIKQQGTTTPLLLVTTGDYIVQYPDVFLRTFSHVVLGRRDRCSADSLPLSSPLW
jgi:hypothetical protein